MANPQRVLAKILPPPGLPRSIAFQSAIIAIGGGMFLTGSVVFFTRVVGLSPVQIGIGFSVGALVSVVSSVPLGAVADKVGGQRTWAIGAAVEALCFASYPLIGGFLAFLAVMVVAATADAYATFGRTIYTSYAFPPETRVRTMAFARSYLNIGFTIGAGLGAAALAINSRAALIAMALVNAVGLVANSVIVARLPALTIPPTPAHVTVSRTQALRDRPYLSLSALFALLGFHGVIAIEILPLWAITHTDAPKPLLGGLFALNTLMAVLLQVPATRGAHTLAGATRLLRYGAWVSALACPVIALSGRTTGWVTAAVLGLGMFLLTGTELWTAAAAWYAQTELPPAHQRGAYAGANRMVNSVGRVFAPVSLTFLAIATGGWGWWIIGAMFVGCAVATRPIVAWVDRTPREATRPARRRTGPERADHEAAMGDAAAAGIDG